MGENICEKNVFGIRPCLSFCSASAKNFHLGASRKAPLKMDTWSHSIYVPWCTF